MDEHGVIQAELFLPALFLQRVFDVIPQGTKYNTARYYMLFVSFTFITFAVLKSTTSAFAFLVLFLLLNLSGEKPESV